MARGGARAPRRRFRLFLRPDLPAADPYSTFHPWPRRPHPVARHDTTPRPGSGLVADASPRETFFLIPGRATISDAPLSLPGKELAASGQPPLTEAEVITALHVALIAGLEERGHVTINGVTRPRPLEEHSVLTIQRILGTGTVPRMFEIDVQVAEAELGLRYWTFLPTIRLRFNDIVIRQVYLSSIPRTDGERPERSWSWWTSNSYRPAYVNRTGRIEEVEDRRPSSRDANP